MISSTARLLVREVGRVVGHASAARRAARRAAAGLLPALLLLGAAAPVAAQSPLASQTLGRGYWHMFLGYAVAWILILAWLWSIARRLGRVERKLDRE